MRQPRAHNAYKFPTPVTLLQALAASGLDAWMWLELVPLAAHRTPPFRAWSGGMQAGVSGAASGMPVQVAGVLSARD